MVSPCDFRYYRCGDFYYRLNLKECKISLISYLKRHCFVLSPWYIPIKNKHVYTIKNGAVVSEGQRTVSSYPLIQKTVSTYIRANSRLFPLSASKTHYNVLRSDIGLLNTSKSNMVFYCDNVRYNSISNIPYDLPDVQYYKRQIDGLKFSDGTAINPSNALWYAKLCYAHQCHLESVDKACIDADGYNKETGEDYNIRLNLNYRTSHRYKKRNIARGYKLIEELNSSSPATVKKEIKQTQKEITRLSSLLSCCVRSDSYSARLSSDIDSLKADLDRLEHKYELLSSSDGVTMATYTAGQRASDGRAYDFIERNQQLIEAKKKLHDNIRKNHPKVPYLVSIEPHKTGYIHFHVVYGCHIPEPEQHRLKLLWESYGIGSYEHGLQFSFYDGAKTSKKEGQREYKNDIDGALRYTIKYVAKTMSDGLDRLEQQKDNLKLQFYKADKGKNASRPKEEIQKDKIEISKLLAQTKQQIKTKQRDSISFSQFLADSCIWYVSKTSNKQYQGIRSFYISPVWNFLIRDKFTHDGVMEFRNVILSFGRVEKPMLINGLSVVGDDDPPVPVLTGQQKQQLLKSSGVG